MPIDYKKYPVNWKKEIVPMIKERANHRCEFCGLINYSVGARIKGVFYHACGNAFYDCAGAGIDFPSLNPLTYKKAREIADGLNEVRTEEEDFKYFPIVLTVAHLDQDVNNNSPENLKALCQKCHLDYDRKFRENGNRKNQLACQFA